MSTSPARHDHAMQLRDGRKLGIAEFGSEDGHPVIWFHGTPGARWQLPPIALPAVERLGLRLVMVERPGVGLSTSHQYGCIAEWAPDVEQVLDQLGIDRFGVVGLSGGGPYALACAARLPDRVHAAAILGGVVPTVGPDACDGGFLLRQARWLKLMIPPAAAVTGTALWGLIQLAGPFGDFLFDRYSAISPEGDQAVFAMEGMREMFLEDIRNGSRKQFRAILHDAILFGREWGFRLAEVEVPVHWWHGDADPIVTLQGAKAACELLPDVELYVRPGESHLGGFAAAPEVLSILADLRAQAAEHGA